MERSWTVKLLAFIIVIMLLATLAIGLAACEEEDRDPSHYNYYPCTHCHGTGRTQTGAECGWCNGTGMYAVKKAGY